MLGSGLGNNTSSIAWISETELSNGQIPAAVTSDIEFGIKNDTRQAALPVATSGRTAQSGSRELTMNKGSVLLAPKVDTCLNTAYGKVDIKAGALVLVLTTSSGMAVYDLDDQHGASVTISANEQKIQLSPGMSAMITSRFAKTFEEVDPAQLFAYRNMSSVEFGNHKAFTGEFSVPATLQSVIPLKQLLSSNNANARRLAAHLLKTTAANLQLRNKGGSYQQMPHPTATAWVN